MFDAKFATTTPTYQQMRDGFANGSYEKEQYWSETRYKKIRGSVNKFEKVCLSVLGISDPSEIPMTPDEIAFRFADQLASGEVPNGCGVRTSKALFELLANVRSAIESISGLRDENRAMSSRQDDWAELIAHLTGKRDGEVLFGNQQMISFLSLARECRQRGLSIKDLSSDIVMEIAPDLAQRTVDSIWTAIRELNKLGGTGLVPDGLLPNIASENLRKPNATSIRRIPLLSKEYKALMEEFIATKVEGRTEAFFDGEVRNLSVAGVGPARSKNIMVALRWFWSGLVALDLAGYDKPLEMENFTQPVVVLDVMRACSNGKLGPVCDPLTRRARVNDVLEFLETLSPGIRSKMPEKFFDDCSIKRKTDHETSNVAFKRKTCLEFIRDEDIQRRFFSMPYVFFSEAVTLIENFDDLRSRKCGGISKEQNRALEIAIMAALTAINTRFPARLDTLSKLDALGEKPHILFPTSQGYEECLTLDIPGYIMKNHRFASGVPLHRGDLTDPRKILKWYLERVHPLVLRFKHRKNGRRRPELLFTGLHIKTLRNYWEQYTLEIGLEMTPHMCRHALASLLKARGVPIADIAALLCISEEVVAGSYAFVDQAMIVQDVMNVQAKIFRDLGV